jgi:hypothetical protein
MLIGMHAALRAHPPSLHLSHAPSCTQSSPDFPRPSAIMELPAVFENGFKFLEPIRKTRLLKEALLL